MQTAGGGGVCGRGSQADGSESKIAELRIPVRTDEDVLGLEVTVDDGEHMQMLEGKQYLRCVRGRLKVRVLEGQRHLG